MRILLIAGGWSTEREISLRGAENIAKTLRERGHHVTPFDPANELHTLLQAAAEHDAAFINLHGAPGEDGLIQAMLDHARLPYQGAGPAASFLALHKSAAKQLFRAAGLLTPDWEFLPVPPTEHHRPRLVYPFFVKSDTGGSSLRLARVTDEQSLYATLREIFNAGEEALLEEAVEGREVLAAYSATKPCRPSSSARRPVVSLTIKVNTPKTARKNSVPRLCLKI